MSTSDFEYAIKKDVRNNPIVREIDRARQQELWRSVVVGVVFLAVVLFAALQHFEILRHGYRVERMQRLRVAEEEINRHLQLEVETLRSPERIERLAVQELDLVVPTRNEAIILERVEPVAPPEGSFIVSR